MTNLQVFRAVAASVLCFVLSTVSLAQDTGQRDDVYLVKAGDQLQVSVWKEADLQLTVLVRPDGGFSFPLAGDVRAAGKTVDSIRQELGQKLTRFIPDPVVTVMVSQIGGNMIYVIGQVKEPGSYIMNPRIDVMQALSIAGGATPFASLNDIKILRRQGNRQTVRSFRYGDIEKGRNLEQNILLASGDVVVVP